MTPQDARLVLAVLIDEAERRSGPAAGLAAEGGEAGPGAVMETGRCRAQKDSEKARAQETTA